MFGRWKRWNRRERICCILAMVCLFVLMPVSLVFIFIIPTPRTHFGLWLNRFALLMLPVLMGLADWRTDRRSSIGEFAMAGLFLLVIILTEIF